MIRRFSDFRERTFRLETGINTIPLVSLGIYPADQQNDKTRYSRAWHNRSLLKTNGKQREWPRRYWEYVETSLAKGDEVFNRR